MEISILVFLPEPKRLCFHRCLSVCLSVCLQLCKNLRTDLHEIFRPMNKRLSFADDPDHHLGSSSGCVTIERYGKWVSTDCAVRCGSAQQALAIATIMSLRHRPTTDVPWRRYALSQCFLYLFLVSPRDRCRPTAQLMKDRDRQQ